MPPDVRDPGRYNTTGAQTVSEGTKTTVSVTDVPDVPAQLRRGEYEQLRQDAAKWRALADCPHVAELIAEWLEWHRRKQCRASSNAISKAAKWGSLGPSYTELERRRSTYTAQPLTPQQIRAQAAASWAELERGQQ